MNGCLAVIVWAQHLKKLCIDLFPLKHRPPGIWMDNGKAYLLHNLYYVK